MGIAAADTRQRAIQAYLNQQGTQTQIASIYGVNLRTFQRWLFRYQQTGVAAPLARGHRHAVYEGAALVALDELVQLRISRESYQGIQHNLPGKTVKVTSEFRITYQAD